MISIKKLLPVLFVALMLLSSSQGQLTPPTFSRIVVFGDSLSDDGNVRFLTKNKSFGTVDYPSNTFNYSNGRFTDDTNGTDPVSRLYHGVWHEQLAQRFLNIAPVTFSEGGGFDFAYGGAMTEKGSHQETVGGPISITITDIGNQIPKYLAQGGAVSTGLYAIWGGGNDLLNDSSEANIQAATGNIITSASQLANAGARNLIVPDLPPLGAVPKYNSDEASQIRYDAASLRWRQVLSGKLKSLQANYLSSGIILKIYPLDVWLNFVKMVINPAVYGIGNVKDSAQGNSGVNPDTYLFWDDLHPTTATHFQIASEANRLLSGGVGAENKSVNLSTRANVGTGQSVAIGGFIVAGTTPKRVVIRGIGPSLAQAGLNGILADPTLELRNASQGTVEVNDNWKQLPLTDQNEIISKGLAPQNDLESAMIVTLPPGSYTTILSGVNAGTGIGLFEVYDVDAESPGESRLVNLSTRGMVGTGDNVMIGGFIVQSDGSENPISVIRGLGPSLALHGVTGALQDPQIEVRDGNGVLIGVNNNWREQINQSIAIKATTLQPSDDREATITLNLNPGNYTTILKGVNGTTGIGLVEVYRVE